MIEKYTTAQLDILIAEGTKNQTVEIWIAKILAGYKKMLQDKPVRYRAFGPYWWPLKSEYIESGDMSFGSFLDQDWLGKMDYGEARYNIAAAFAYEENQFDLGLMDWPFHTMEDDGNPVEFVSADPDMERI